MVRSFCRKLLALVVAVTVLISVVGLNTGVSFAAADMDAVSLAKKYVGTGYIRGGQTPSSGFNASGLVYYVFNKLDYDMPRHIDDQFREGSRVTNVHQLKYGDLLFFGPQDRPTFTGIYIGERE